MQPTTDPKPYDYSTEKLSRRVAAEIATLRELLTAVAHDVKRLACEHLQLARALSGFADGLAKPAANDATTSAQGVPSTSDRLTLVGVRGCED